MIAKMLSPSSDFLAHWVLYVTYEEKSYFVLLRRFALLGITFLTQLRLKVNKGLINKLNCVVIQTYIIRIFCLRTQYK